MAKCILRNRHAVCSSTRRPIDDLVLQMKSMDIDKVVHFPFPTPPDAKQLLGAENRLLLLGALEPPPHNIRLKRKYA